MLPYATLRARLLRFYNRHSRDLPWRRTKDPYRIWLSEIMLQQTKVDTVVQRYQQLLQQFPTVSHLAQASEQQVCAAWAGLGYYRRAKALHAAATIVMEQFGGQLPQDVASLLKLPGIGPYTAGAIASIAFGQQVPLVDGNVERVLCRLLALEENPRSPAGKRLLWQVAGQLVQGERPGDLNQALMELGATVCTPKQPQCDACPVRATCGAYALGTPQAFPILPAKARPKVMPMGFVLCQGKQGWWLYQRGMAGLWPGLWEPFAVEGEDGAEALQARWQVDIIRPLASLVHLLTHRRVEAIIYLGRLASTRRQRQDCRMLADPLQAPLSMLARKVLRAGFDSLHESATQARKVG